MTDTTIRLGIIGTGLAVEKLHWPALTALGDRFAVTAFCDIDRDHAEHFASYAGASMEDWTDDYHQLLARNDVDAVLISLPIPLQAEVPAHALEAGKNVICEKPPGPDEPDARGLIAVAEAHPDRVLLIAENYFYKDNVRWAKHLIENGELGRIHMMAYRQATQMLPEEGEFSGTRWRQEGEYTGGVHLDGGVHQIAQIRMLLGDVERLSAETQDANDIFGGPSDLIITMRFVSGAIGSYIDSEPEHFLPQESNAMRIYGTEGTMVLEGTEVSIHREDGTETYAFPNQDGGFQGEFQNFHEAVVHGAPVVGTLNQSIRNMEIVTKSIRSAETGETISLDDTPEPLSATPLPMWMPHGAQTLDIAMETSRERPE
jgi:predicted dehydrogenase